MYTPTENSFSKLQLNKKRNPTVSAVPDSGNNNSANKYLHPQGAPIGAKKLKRIANPRPFRALQPHRLPLAGAESDKDSLSFPPGKVQAVTDLQGRKRKNLFAKNVYIINKGTLKRRRKRIITSRGKARVRREKFGLARGHKNLIQSSKKGSADQSIFSREKRIQSENLALGAKRTGTFQSPRGSGTIYIQSTHNNTIYTLTDNNGKARSWVSAGACGFKNTRKATSYASQAAAEKCASLAKAINCPAFSLRIRGLGSGKLSGVRTIHQSGLRIKRIWECTTLPHNGCRRKKSRRI